MSGRRRLLMITAAYPGRVDPGRAVFVSHMARELSRTMDVSVLAPRIHRRDPLEERNGAVEIRRFPFLSEGRLLKEYRRVPRAVAVSYLLSGAREAIAAARRTRPDAVLCHWVLPTGPLGLAASRTSGAPLLLYAHGSDVQVYADRGPFFRRIARECLGEAARVIAVSEMLRDRIVGAFSVRPERVSVIPCGFDPRLLEGESREETRARLGVPAGAPLLIAVGDLTEAKGLRVLADALRRVDSAGEAPWLCLVGRGPGEALLRDRPRTHFTGGVPNEQVGAYLRAADLFVLPSLSEGMPVSILEAQALGLPVVASRVGGVPEFVRDGETGTLVPPGDPEALADAIAALLGDADARSRMGRAGRAIALESTADRRSAEVATLIEETIAAPGAPTAPGGATAAERYDAYWTSTRRDRRDARSLERAEAVLRLLARDAGHRQPNGDRPTLLDVGCGRGVVAEAMRERGYDVRGVDVSEEAVREARRRDVAAERLDVEREPIEGRYDVVVCLEVLEHLHEPAAVLRRLAGAIRPGGRLVISLPESPPVIRHALRDAEGHIHALSREEALRLFREAGLRLLDEDVLSVAPPRWGLLKGVLDAAARRAPGALAIARLYALAPEPAADGP